MFSPSDLYNHPNDKSQIVDKNTVKYYIAHQVCNNYLSASTAASSWNKR